ncbi:ABC transporter permease [Oceanithermus sp.]|uniref:ABC transporter permease n=1 Tax=Oceanithermus sp. TaxID=2268145 RepID=UPI00257BB8ED|nr:FtsX-like permease family protein [Oceanithermus sp.]
MKGARFGVIVRLAWRNIWRHRQRTYLLAAVVAYASVATIFYWSMIDGYKLSVLEAHARYVMAPVTVARTAWFDDPDPENGLRDLAPLRAALERAGSPRYAPRLQFAGLLTSPYLSEGAFLLGVDPAAEPAVSRVPGKVTEGRWLEAPGEVVLGYKLAERLDVRLGERLVVSTAALAGPQSLGLEVVGLVHARVSSVDRSGVYLHLDDARALTGLSGATHLAVDAPLGREEGVARRVAAQLPRGLTAHPVWDLVGPIKTDVEAGKKLSLPIGLLLALFAALAVTSTLIVSVLERTREFGVVLALGMDNPKLGWMIVLEAAFATAVGWLLGLVLGYALIYYTGTHNVLGPFFQLSGEVWSEAGLTEEFYTHLSPVYALYSLITVVVSALSALLFPALRARRLHPSEALRWD